MNKIEQMQIEELQQQLMLKDMQLSELRAQVETKQAELLLEKQKLETLLLDILPKEICLELLKDHSVEPQFYKSVSVLFLDVAGFTSMCERIELRELITELNTHFTNIDDICERHYLEKIKTIGDAYLCVGGMPMRNHSHPVDAVAAALEMLQYMEKVNVQKRLQGKELWNVRIGVHTGSVIAGVIGKKKFLYDIWGDTVNVASRMETGSDVGKINISGVTYDLVKDYFACSYRGKMPVKNKEDLAMYFVDGYLPQYSMDETGTVPNSNFTKALQML